MKVSQKTSTFYRVDPKKYININININVSKKHKNEYRYKYKC